MDENIIELGERDFHSSLDVIKGVMTARVVGDMIIYNLNTGDRVFHVVDNKTRDYFSLSCGNKLYTSDY